jgi:hypothetical protein
MLLRQSVPLSSFELRINVLFTTPSPLTPKPQDKGILISRTGPWITLTERSPCMSVLFLVE